MIVELTKEFRHKVYKKALEIYIEHSNTYGMCYAINNAMFVCCGIEYAPLRDDDYYTTLIENYKDVSPYHFINQWPEIFNRKPEVPWDGAYWFSFSTEGINKRKAILRAAIKETRKIYNK